MTLAKVLPLIDDLIRNFEALCDIFSDADLATTALLPFLGRRDGIVFVFPDLKGDALHLIAVTYQESCRHELSTPPLIPSNTVGFFIVTVLYRQKRKMAVASLSTER